MPLPSLMSSESRGGERQQAAMKHCMNADRDGLAALQETDRELILRFFAMGSRMADYRMPLSSFLNDEADRGIHLDKFALQHRRDLFKKALHNVGHHLLCFCTFCMCTIIACA